MNLSELAPVPGSKTLPKRKGRGCGSGNGKTAGKGHKGQNCRAGGGVRPGFEGGQTPLYRRIPKRGFNNTRFATVYSEVSLSSLNLFDNGAVIDAETLFNAGIIRKMNDGVSVLANGELTKNLTVKASKFSKSAAEKIVAAGGKAEVI